MSESNQNTATVETEELTVNQIVHMETALSTLSQCKTLGGRVAYRVSRLLAKLRPEYEAFNDARNALVLELGTDAENGQKIVKKDNIETFNTRLQEIVDHKFHIDFIKLTIDDIAKADLSPIEYVALEPILVHPDAEPVVG